ncbi:hypothetical protein WM03_08540 [Burkholderia ubonensis]|uniref:Mu transposase C-terminal domain-containing protein n=1 Tax=Burkholderia ubonensis TaxID=101571 RepID=UPI00075E046C|nr:Mu transposase C-terminal domain-containing protein [Burkholderia ubonensis]KVN70529.1 hypothetical protein WJ65_06800 [Burkholderia ubonensis]KWI33722.1 hypothetical protein WM03_08540 [Burkholderia ubonensis]OJA32966.1 hypothetical protein BGV58_03300 [Burkholderia ubonensis]OJB60830.1 hypothetical protein BGV62_24410 [Burkholderia ubonensis]
MLTDAELHELFERLNTPAAGRQKIQWIREHAPVRAVSGGKKSHVVRYASRKMGFTIVCEAKSTEYSAAVTWDFDDETLEFYPQPAFLTFNNRLTDGRVSSSTYVPDFLRITHNGFEFVECKTEQDLEREARARPHIYSIDDASHWRRPSAEEHVAGFGATFTVRSTLDNNPVLIENLEFLRDYLLASPPRDADLYSQLRNLLVERRWCTIATIINTIPGIADTLYTAIVEGSISFDIATLPISDAERAMVFPDADSAALYGTFARSQVGASRHELLLSLNPGTKFEWDGTVWEVINLGNTGIYCRCLEASRQVENGFVTLTNELVDALAREGKLVPYSSSQDDSRENEALGMLRRASDEQQMVALERYKCLFETGYTGRLKAAKRRTRQYWLAHFREAEASFGLGLLGLLPNWRNSQGNHERKIAPTVVNLMERVIQTDWSDPRQKTTTALYGKIVSLCDENGLSAPSRKTFRQEILKLKTRASIARRYGSRITYEMEPIPTIPDGYLTYSTPRHGTHPFHVGHIDHTPLPIRVVSNDGSRVLSSVWITLMVCAYSRKVLAFYLTFDNPSYRSNMMVIRDCVRRHARLPQFIVVDNGKDFQSTYFDRLLAALHRHKLNRRPSQPRDGSLIESLFNVTQANVIFNLPGNTQADREYRKKTKEVDPKRLATWTFSQLSDQLDRYFNEVYHRNHHSTLGCSPNEMFARGLTVCGPRTHARIPYSRTFLMLTFPSTDKGTAKVTSRGVKINYCYYSCPALRAFKTIGQRVAVRYDPFNMGTAYVYVDQLWHECHSEHYMVFRGRSEKEVQIASEFLKAKFRKAGIHAPLNAKRLADFLCTVEGDDVLKVQRLHQDESQPAQRRDESALTSQDIPVWPEADDADELDLDEYKPHLLGDL